MFGIWLSGFVILISKSLVTSLNQHDLRTTTRKRLSTAAPQNTSCKPFGQLWERTHLACAVRHPAEHIHPDTMLRFEHLRVAWDLGTWDLNLEIQ
jgi:hypothetical protein